MLCRGRTGVLTTPHPAASEAGLRVLAEGGTAIDALIAAGAVLAAVFPHMTGIGGDALWIVHDRRLRGIMGIGQAGHRPPPRPISARGPGSVATSAGAIAAWQLAREISCREWASPLSLARLLDEAIAYAEGGATVSASQAFWLAQRRAMLDSLPDLASLSAHADGRALQAGDRFWQPELAHTLRRLASAGLMDFYQGETARALARGFDRLDCGLSAADLRATRARATPLVELRYRAGSYYNFPAPSQGIYTARALASLGRFDLGALGRDSPARCHLMVEAIKQALGRRNLELCDPDFSPLDSAAVATGAAPLNPGAASPWAEVGRPADTVWLAASDSRGRSACLMQSLFHDFGSGCMIGDTGVLWHNRAAGFSAARSHPNAWAPGKRPAHTLNPSCYFGDDGQRYFFGSQGGDGQPQTQLVLATELIDFRQGVDAALRAPRFLLGRSFFDSSDALKLEAPLARALGPALAALGHQVETIPALSPYTGQAGVLAIAPDGAVSAMHDPRGEGSALALDPERI